MNKTVVVELENVTFSYQKIPVLEDVSFQIFQNDLVTIVGPNGGGKTTLVKLLLGLIKPSKGTIKIFNQPPQTSYQRIGYMAQHVGLDPQFPVSVQDVVLMGRLGLKRSGWYGRDDRAAAIQALRDVHMDEFAQEAFSELSGGQRRRVLIARALTSNPDILIMDEPMANVDVKAQNDFFNIISKLTSRMTILIVSHDLGFVFDIVNRVLCVNRRAVMHPTTQLTGDFIKDIYGGDVKMIRHDHQCSPDGHVHDVIP